MWRVKGLRAALRQCVGACARSAYPGGPGAAAPGGTEGSEGAGAPPPPHRRPRRGGAPPGRTRAGAIPSPGPSGGRGRRTTRRREGADYTKPALLLATAGETRPAAPPARRRGRGKPAARQFGPGPRVKRPRPELNKRGVLFKGREAGGGDPRKPPVGPRPVSAPGVPGRSWSGALRLAEATALPDPPQAAQEGQVWGGTAWRDTPEIVVTECDNLGGD